MSKVTQAVGETGAVLLANGLAVGGSTLVFLDNIELFLKVVVAFIDITIGATTVMWIRGSRAKKRLELETMRLDLELKRRELRGGEEASQE